MFHWMKRFSVALVLLFAAALPLPAARADAADPAIATVQGFYDSLLDSMKGGKALGAQGRFAKLRPVVDRTFDIGTMIKYAVGPGWDTASAADQKALSDAFARMTAAQYAGNFDSFNGEKFVVDPNVVTRGSICYVSASWSPKTRPSPSSIACASSVRAGRSSTCCSTAISRFRSTAPTSPPR